MLKDLRETAAGGRLPDSLRERLKKIPRTTVVCRDRDRLYRAARRRRRAASEPADAAALEHLAGCERCAAVYGALATAFREPLPRPPARLRARLRAIARRPERLLPVWITDSRYATAACIVLAMFLTALADDATALLSDTTGKVGTRTAVWMKQGGDQGRATWNALAGALDRTYHKSQERLEDFGTSCEELFRETFRVLGALVNTDPEKPHGGESDDDTTSDPA